MAFSPARRTARALIAVAAVTAGLVVTQTSASADEDPRIEQYRQALAELKPLAQQPPCDQVPEPDRWVDAGTPDKGSDNVVISAHRGALTLAPENTLKSYEYAFAYGVDMVEVDVQQTRDGRFVAMHDSTVDRTTNGTGAVKDLTFDEIRALNAADYAPWSGGEYDGSQVASLDEILDLARRAGRGVELDIKGSVSDDSKVAELVGQYGLIEESIFNTGDPEVLRAEPGARMIYNRDTWEPGFLMYEIAEVFKVFGSRLDEYSPESIAAAHDACSIVMPHAYDAGADQEVAQFQLARSMGADGVQTNQPALIVAAAGEAVDSKLVVHTTSPQTDDVCLVNADNGLGFPEKSVRLTKDEESVDLPTGKDGCAAVPSTNWRGATMSFAGDGAVHASEGRLVPHVG
ncbi:glycerophosphodiester phosphodiesterase family protein [Saccharopolyspora sp. K220]|uniref:glycerophosphodiester phosphodiesterase n=1 Tax=Saccharopolyspora soli TaxID=2926618 RepID=UPI001F58EA91|nr:glycerophosphodiester phosphodiesterase family protein [Saccharopolyspora soli]MCI2416857.1 glycerophosphodiester phosphodiesterase family protein [Saccharopolyspora soli]